MAAAANETHVSVLNTSIRCDSDTFRWFRRMLAVPEIRELLSAEAQDSNRLKRLTRLTAVQAGLLATAATTAACALSLRRFWLLIPAAAIAGLAGLCANKSKQLTADLGTALVLNYFPDLDLMKYTLYGMTEVIARTHNTVSLVELINILESIHVRGIAAGAFIALTITPPGFTIRYRFVLLLALCLILPRIMQSLWLLRDFRKKSKVPQRA